MYGDITTTGREEDTSDSQVTPQAEEIEPGEEQTSITEESQAAEETVPDTITPLPCTSIRCSTSHGPRPIQLDHEQVSTPIRATVTAEGTPGTEAVNQGQSKIKLEGLNEKKRT